MYTFTQHMPILSASLVEPSKQPGWDSGVTAAYKRRAPRIWQMAYVAAHQAIDTAQTQPRSIVCGTALGALDETCRYLDGAFNDGFGSPRNFIASVHNSMAGNIALDFKIDGPNLTVCESQNSFASAIVATSLLDPADFPVLVLVIDEKTGLIEKLHPHLSSLCRDYMDKGWSEAAVCFILSAAQAEPAAGLKAFGPRLIGKDDPANACSALCAAHGFDPAQLSPLAETSDSFIKPAFCAYQHFRAKTPGTHLIGSYSPTAKAVALVSICA